MKRHRKGRNLRIVPHMPSFPVLLRAPLSLR